MSRGAVQVADQGVPSGLLGTPVQAAASTLAYLFAREANAGVSVSRKISLALTRRERTGSESADA